MEKRWCLKGLYPSFDCAEFRSDLNWCEAMLSEFDAWVKKNLKNSDNAVAKITEFIKMQNDFRLRFSRLFHYSVLTLSVDAKNEKALQSLENLQAKLTELTSAIVNFEQWVGTLENLDAIISSSEYLQEYRFHLEETAAKSKYLLSDKEELIIAKMDTTGAAAWTKLQQLLTSTLMVDITLKGEKTQLPLPVARSLAYDKDPVVRNTGYEAELQAYKKIEDSMAACLNGIKGQVITVAKLRGFNSPLEETLFKSRMDEETLNAMLTAIKEYLPVFHKYFRRKGELLGHKNGIPFQDLFAPMGDADMRFTYEDARTFIVKNFGNFSAKLANFADNAFENRWIDAEPREGKQGGAFCYNLPSIKESRILSNYSGNLSELITLAHELGHAYHGDCLKDEAILNFEYPMPLAETASIFAETIIIDAALKTATKEEAFTILEADLVKASQVIVDIYSRYLFETELFKRRADHSLSVNELKEMMLAAQKEAYGSGLDHNYLHPYMWVCKSHYYAADLNFYNFPYAFGLLFAKGVYAVYLERGEAFVGEFDRLLSLTGKNNVADVAKMVGIDIRSADFWRRSLQVVEKDIEEFLAIS